jgi:hypothetical protein
MANKSGSEKTWTPPHKLDDPNYKEPPVERLEEQTGIPRPFSAEKCRALRKELINDLYNHKD